MFRTNNRFIRSEYKLKKRPTIIKHYTTYRLHLYKYILVFLDYIYNEKFKKLYLNRKYNKYYEYKNRK